MRYLISLGEQAFASILNLALSLWMIRQVGAAEYGAFVLWNNVALILSSVQNALIICHLQALPPNDPNRAEPERLLLAVNTLLLLAAALACFAASWLGGNGLLAPRAVIAFVPAFLLYQYARALAFTRGAVIWAACTTLGVLILCIALFTAAWFAHVKPRADVAIALLAIGYGAAGLISLRHLDPKLRLLIPWPELQHYRRYAGDSAWVLLGVGSAEFIQRFYSFIVAAWFGPAALGTLSAAQVLLRPATLAVNAWGWVARAEMAGSRDSGNWRAFVTSLVRGIIGVLLISLPWAAIVYLAWPLASRILYAGRFAGIGWIALLWGISAACGGVQNALSVSLQALRAFRKLAYADFAAALTTVIATLLFLARLGYPYAVAGMICGQLVGVILLAALLWRWAGKASGRAPGLSSSSPATPQRDE